jgi:prepilin peptidase CpaA
MEARIWGMAGKIGGLLQLKTSLTSVSGYVKIRGSGAFEMPRRHKPAWFPRVAGRVSGRVFSRKAGGSLRLIVLGPAVALALIAGWTDWRSRRIPNWLTVPGFVIGVSVNVLVGGWLGLKTSLLGAGLGLLVLLPFVFLRSLGAGDWKLAGALGAFVGWGALVDLLMGSILVAGVMALALVIYKRRFVETLRNIGGILVSMVTFRMPRSEVSLDNPKSLKVPYGVALALTTLIFGVVRMWGARS